jgi:hypothetical protein
MWQLGFDLRSGHVGYVMDRMAVGQIFSKNFSHLWQFSFDWLLDTHFHILGWYSRPTSGQQWTQSYLTPQIWNSLPEQCLRMCVLCTTP